MLEAATRIHIHLLAARSAMQHTARTRAPRCRTKGLPKAMLSGQCRVAYGSPATAAALSTTNPIATSRSLCDVLLHDSHPTAIGPHAPATHKANAERRCESRTPIPEAAASGHDGQRGNSLGGEGEAPHDRSGQRARAGHNNWLPRMLFVRATP